MLGLKLNHVRKRGPWRRTKGRWWVRSPQFQVWCHAHWGWPWGSTPFPWSGLGFFRPKPVFPVQNWEKLSKTGKNYAGLYFKPEKVSKKCDLSNKNLTRQTRSSFHTYCSYGLWARITQILWTQFFALILLIIQLVLTFPHNIKHAQKCFLIFMYQ